jgi:translation initiation factor eIF-2B subunit gamma
MVWYPITYCYQMGITDITLITPPSSAEAITAALNTNPHLTGLPLPKPDLLAPKGLDQNTGTAQIFRLEEVRNVIKGNFIVLPCDIICELGGEHLVESWMVREATLKGVTGSLDSKSEPFSQMGGLGVWYDTQGENIIKGEETDFLATSLLEGSATPSRAIPLLKQVSNLVISMPTDTLQEVTEKHKTLPIRQSLFRSHSRVRMLSKHRDAHIYLFPAWVLDMINRNDHMDSVGEDVIGWWAKARWQDGLAKKLNLHETFGINTPELDTETVFEEEVDYATLSTTRTPNLTNDAVSKLVSGHIRRLMSQLTIRYFDIIQY